MNGARLGFWLIRLITWDGLLPAVVWSAPILVGLLIPHRRGAIEVTAVVLPIVACLIRFQVGRRYILSNQSGVVMRRFQVAAFCTGLFVLVFIDAVLVLSHVMPHGAAFATTGDRIMWAVLFAVYLILMAIAMFPGSCPPLYVIKGDTSCP